MLFSVEQAFVGRDEKRAPLKMPAWEANRSPKETQTRPCYESRRDRGYLKWTVIVLLRAHSCLTIMQMSALTERAGNSVIKILLFYKLSASKCNCYTHMLQLSLPLTLSNGNSMSGVQFREYQS